MIHKIKALYDNGNGLSMRQIASELGISRNSVKKYINMSAEAIHEDKEACDRPKMLDVYKDYIINLLKTYPNLSAVKILRKLKEKNSELQVSARSVRRYIEALKGIVACKQIRYYQPVLDMVAGVQCQVDPGELRGIVINGVETPVYFVVFVLSYSRLMYVSISKNPINTEILIQMHDRAFRFFGGCVEECVYDQTKMVVIQEEYRELWLNERFYEYATWAGFNIRACEGYDPESKGKVEAGVKFVKYNGLYGEKFNNWSELESYVQNWLETIANPRVHGTTGLIPQIVYQEQELAHMRPYNSPSFLAPNINRVTRKSDKTGLISWKSNKYSVPLAYQRSVIAVEEEEDSLILYALDTGNKIAQHSLSFEKGRIIQKKHHYRDLEEKTAILEQKIADILGPEQGLSLCNVIKRTLPKIYKDQLRGIIQILSSIPAPIESKVIERLCQRQSLTASAVRDYLLAYSYKNQSKNTKKTPPPNPLASYDKLLPNGGSHAIH